MISISKFSGFESAKHVLDSIGQFHPKTVLKFSGFERAKHALDSIGQFQKQLF